jgi:signal transduction histidine kinase
MQCPRCDAAVANDAAACPRCGASLEAARLDVLQGEMAGQAFPLFRRAYSLGRARGNDLALADPSISKTHARLVIAEGAAYIEDLGSRHGVYVDSARVQRGDLRDGSQIQLGNVTLRFTLAPANGASGQADPRPWMEQQKLLLSLVQALNSTLVVSEVLEQVVDAVMTITGAERGFLLLEGEAGDGGAEPVDGLQVRVARRRGGAEIPLGDVHGLSGSVVRKALHTREAVATGNAMADPSLRTAESVILLDLRTIVCIPLLTARVEGGVSTEHALGAIYVDNPETSAPITPDRLGTAEALARHAALAIANAQLFESERAKTRELREAQSRLLQSEKLATIGQMAAGIAHELNTPLTYIMGNVELLSGQALEARQAAMLKSIGHGAERIKDLVQSLLAFSRPSAEAHVPLAANDVVERSLELCHYQIVKGGVQLQKYLAEPSPRITGVSNQLEMALINLLVNAVHAMEGGGTLTVGTAARGPEVEIAVADTGHGIPEDIRASIFEPFFTTKPEGKGTGLGLATVMMIVERHHGRIDVQSAPGRGTTFRVILPAA